MDPARLLVHARRRREDGGDSVCVQGLNDSVALHCSITCVAVRRNPYRQGLGRQSSQCMQERNTRTSRVGCIKSIVLCRVQGRRRRWLPLRLTHSRNGIMEAIVSNNGHDPAGLLATRYQAASHDGSSHGDGEPCGGGESLEIRTAKLRFHPPSMCRPLTWIAFCLPVLQPLTPSLDEVTDLLLGEGVSLSNVKDAPQEAAGGSKPPRTRGNMVPVYLSMPADLMTPVLAYLRMSEGASEDRRSFLCESIQTGEKIGRYSFIGVGTCRDRDREKERQRSPRG